MAQPKPVDLFKHDTELAWEKLAVVTLWHVDGPAYVKCVLITKGNHK